jgi:hypothetical protein
MTDGGEGAVGAHQSQQKRDKLRAAQAGKKASPEARRNMALAHIGRAASPETRARMSAARTGERHPNSKLTDAQVVEIRERSTGRRGEQTEMAAEFGVTQAAISWILKGHRKINT